VRINDVTAIGACERALRGKCIGLFVSRHTSMAWDPGELPSHRKLFEVPLGLLHEQGIRTGCVALDKHIFTIFAVSQEDHAISIRKSSPRVRIYDHASTHAEGAHLSDVVGPFPERCKHTPFLPPGRENSRARTTRARVAMTRPIRVTYDGVWLDRRDHLVGLVDCKECPAALSGHPPFQERQ
jgi:hypothetical protein